MDDKYLTTEQVSEILAVQPPTIRAWARTGYLPSIKLGRQRRFSLSAVQAFVDQSANDGAQQAS